MDGQRERLMLGALMAKRNARKRFAARATNDVDAFVAFFADDAVFKFPGESPVGGTFRGREAIRAQFEQFRDRTADARFELGQRFRESPACVWSDKRSGGPLAHAAGES
jgi:ketosteroid isomerase-like protein